MCANLDSEHWEDNFLAQVGQNDETQTASEEVEEVESDDGEVKVQTYIVQASHPVTERCFNGFCTARDTHMKPYICRCSCFITIGIHQTDDTLLITSRNFNLDTQ